MDEGRGSLIDVLALSADLRRQIAMLVPTPVEDLNTPHTPLNQPTSQQRTGRKGPRLLYLVTIQVGGGLRLAGKVHQVRDAALHAEGHLVLGDARQCLRITPAFMGLGIEAIESVEHHTPVLPADSRRVVDVQHGVTDGPQGHARVAGRQISTAPHASEERLGIGLGRPVGCQHHEGGQFVVLAA